MMDVIGFEALVVWKMAIAREKRSQCERANKASLVFNLKLLKCLEHTLSL